MKFIIMQISPRSIFLPFRSKYPPLNTLFSKTQSQIQSQRQSFAPIERNWQNYSFVYFKL
jgi:hypothetical protein